ncbi:nucleotidyltransferase domain-containing protein [Candidatus Uhrbacteria bacterium]|nr:nucleotidyltransferase domain-containing protein [Candidatus Uhrbacteria bacterium]
MEITEKQEKKIAEVAEKYGLKLVLLFGSQVHGRTHRESDIDIGVLPQKALSFTDEVYLATEFINIFGMTADFTNLYKAPPLLLMEVIKNNHVLYQEEPTAYTDFFVYAKQRFSEAAPIFAMTDAAVRRFFDKNI